MVRASLIDSMSGLSLVTFMAMAQDRVSALNPSNYPSTPHKCVPANEVDKTAHGTSMYLLSHQIALGSIRHFRYLQVGINFFEAQDSKTTMLLRLSSFMDILPEAIGGFTLHPLNKQSTLPASTKNRVEGLLDSSQQLFLNSHLHEEEDYKQPTVMWGVSASPAIKILKKPVNLLPGIWLILAYRSGGRTTSLLT
jgi:hypothetical protein